MSMQNSFCIFAKDESETELFAKYLAKHIKPGDVVLLSGSLGAGKTALVRTLIKTILRQPDLEVPSPTFLLVLPYQNENISILHADLYRLEHEEEIEELGLFDDLENIVFIEWPQRVPWLMQRADMIISLQFGVDDTGRRIEISVADKSRSFSGMGQTIPKEQG